MAHYDLAIFVDEVMEEKDAISAIEEYVVDIVENSGGWFDYFDTANSKQYDPHTKEGKQKLDEIWNTQVTEIEYAIKQIRKKISEYDDKTLSVDSDFLFHLRRAGKYTKYVYMGNESIETETYLKEVIENKNSRFVVVDVHC